MRKSIIYVLGAVLTALSVSSCESNEEVLYSRESDIDVNIAKTPEFNIYSGGTTLFNNISTRAIGQDGMMMTRAGRRPKMGANLPGDYGIMSQAPTSLPYGAINIWSVYNPYSQTICTLETGKTYYVPTGTTFDAPLNMNNCDNFTMYVENGATWKLYDNGCQGTAYKTIYVLPGAKLEWGYNSYNNGDLTIGNGQGATIHCWGTILPRGGGNTITKLDIKANSKLYIYARDMEEFRCTGQLFLENGQNSSYLYSEIPVTFGAVFTNGGDFRFKKGFLCLGDFYANAGAKYVFEKCATVVGNFTLSGSSMVEVNEALTVKGNFNGDGSEIYLNKALLDVIGGTNGAAGEMTLGNNLSLYGQDSDTKSIIRTNRVNVSDYQNTTSADIQAFKKNLIVLCSEDNYYQGTIYQGFNRVNSMTFYDGGAQNYINSWPFAKTQLSYRNVILNPEKYYLPATDCRSQIGENPDGGNPDGDNPDGDNPDGDNPDGDNPDGDNPDGDNPDGDNPDGGNPDGDNPDGGNPDGDNPDGGNTPDNPTPATIDEVEVNLSINDEHINGDYVASKLSIHVRSITDVEVFIPLEKEYYCDKDDMNIALTHKDINTIKYNTESTNVEMEIAGKTVKMTVAFEDDGIRFTTDGIDEDVINFCRTTYGDGVTFEIWNYYNNISRDDLKTVLDQATVEFLDKDPGRYVNAFNKLNSYPGPIYGEPDANGVWTPYIDEACTQVLDASFWERAADGKNYILKGYQNPKDCVVKPVDTAYVTYNEEYRVHYNVYYKKN